MSNNCWCASGFGYWPLPLSEIHNIDVIYHPETLIFLLVLCQWRVVLLPTWQSYSGCTDLGLSDKDGTHKANFKELAATKAGLGEKTPPQLNVLGSFSSSKPVQQFKTTPFSKVHKWTIHVANHITKDNQSCSFFNAAQLLIWSLVISTLECRIAPLAQISEHDSKCRGAFGLQ